MEVLSRRDEIVNAERIRRAGRDQELLNDARKLVEGILSLVDAATAARIEQLPPYIQVMGAPDPPSITRIVRQSGSQDAPGRDFDFSLQSISAHMEDGLAAGRQALRRPKKDRPSSTVGEVLTSPPLASRRRESAPVRSGQAKDVKAMPDALRGQHS